MPRSTGRKKAQDKKIAEPRISEAMAAYAVAPPEPSLTKVTRHGQITLPTEIRRAMDVAEGDLIEVAIDGGRMVLTPKQLVDKSQAWFWTREWQTGEREAEEDTKAGRVKTFRSAKDLLEDLDA